MSLNKVIALARADLGYTESPANSNKTKFGESYGMNGQPWCVMALWYWFREAGEAAAFFGGAKTASCGTLLRWYREQGLTVPVAEVQAGDIVLLNFNGKGTADHCGLVENVGVTNAMWPFVRTIEGNTTPGVEGSQDNGGCVAEKDRLFSQIVGVCRPQYKPEESETIDDITGHLAEKAIRRCMARGLLKGYPDGSFQPDKPVTRAELATVLDRMEDDGK